MRILCSLTIRFVAVFFPGSWLLTISPFCRERPRWRLRFLVVGPGNFGRLFRSGESLGPDRTVAATAPGSWLPPGG
jgi:hypothetical protein